jgi:hypothetical protein
MTMQGLRRIALIALIIAVARPLGLSRLRGVFDIPDR